MLNIESMPRGTEVENGSVKWNAQFWELRKEVHLKGGLVFFETFLIGPS